MAEPEVRKILADAENKALRADYNALRKRVDALMGALKRIEKWDDSKVGWLDDVEVELKKIAHDAINAYREEDINVSPRGKEVPFPVQGEDGDG